jgi:hypothetical protein
MDAMENSLKEWLDHNLPRFLLQINAELLDETSWKMPAVEDFVLVVAVRDYEDGLGGVFTISSGAPAYRIRGLLTEAMSL